jgi:hypothetical protein
MSLNLNKVNTVNRQRRTSRSLTSEKLFNTALFVQIMWYHHQRAGNTSANGLEKEQRTFYVSSRTVDLLAIYPTSDIPERYMPPTNRNLSDMPITIAALLTALFALSANLWSNGAAAPTPQTTVSVPASGSNAVSIDLSFVNTGFEFNDFVWFAQSTCEDSCGTTRLCGEWSSSSKADM